MLRRFVPLVLAVCLPLVSFAGTKVRISTPIGDMVLELYDEEKPVTVANFLRYIEAGRYQDTFAHRLMPGFVVQAGGYSIVGSGEDFDIEAVEKFDAIVNEYGIGQTYSNTFGTIAMAKVPAEDGEGNPIPGGGPDSATCEWFINLGNNASNLDNQNGGFTVFGRVIEGLDVLAQFNTVFTESDTGGPGVYNAGGPLTNLPLLQGMWNTANFVFTGISIEPDPPPAPAAEIKIAGKKKIVTKAKSVKLSGTISGEVAKIEWRVGKKGKLKSRKAGGKWRIRVGGLKPGSNLVFIRGVSADGTLTKFQKRRIVRR